MSYVPDEPRRRWKRIQARVLKILRNDGPVLLCSQPGDTRSMFEVPSLPMMAASARRSRG